MRRAREQAATIEKTINTSVLTVAYVMNSIPPPFLFFDFTGQDEAAFPDYIGAYQAVLKTDDFTDDSKLKTRG